MFLMLQIAFIPWCQFNEKNHVVFYGWIPDQSWIQRADAETATSLDNYMVINVLFFMIGAVITVMETRFKTAVCGRKKKLVNTLLE